MLLSVFFALRAVAYDKFALVLAIGNYFDIYNAPCQVRELIPLYDGHRVFGGDVGNPELRDLVLALQPVHIQMAQGNLPSS